MGLEIKSMKIDWFLVTAIYGNKNFCKDEEFVFQECVYLIKANTPLEAYEAAIACVCKSVPYKENFNTKKWEEFLLLGITDIMPVCESFEHSNELGHRYVYSENWDDISQKLLSREDTFLLGPP